MHAKRTVSLATLVLALALLAGCGGRGAQSSSGSLTPDSIGLNFIRAAAAGDTASAEKLLAASGGDELKGKVQAVMQVFGRYDISNIEVASTREWRQDASDRRVEIRFQFKPKGSDEAIKIGLITVRTTASGGLHFVSDVILDRPTE
jgi:hypothetical protein